MVFWVTPLSPEEIHVSVATRRPERAHRATVTMDIAEIATYLQETLGLRLTAHLADVKEPKTVTQWAKGVNAPRPAAEERLRTAYQVFHLLQQAESPHVVRAWFIGMNPQLDDDAPADAIRDGRFKDVLLAAKAFLAGG